MMGEIPWSEVTGFPVLSTLIGLPLVFMLAALRAEKRGLAWTIGFAGSLAELGVALFLLARFDAGSADFQFTEHTVFLSVLNYHLGVDGISLGFVLLTALLTVLALLFREIGREAPAGLYVATVLACEATAMGMLLALDLAQFWVAAGLELWPVTLILRRWGGDEDRTGLRVYLRFAGSGLAMLGGGVFLLGLGHARATGVWSFDLAALLEAERARKETRPPRTLVAFTDPNDQLSYLLRPAGYGDAAATVDVQVSNAPAWLGLFANPWSAHTGYGATTEVMEKVVCGHPRSVHCR